MNVADQQKQIDTARAMLHDAASVVILAGAGMGVDSGLPDFRGPEGFWRAYPGAKRMKLNFIDLANPAAFQQFPRLAWGFYGHRLQLYRNTTPHAGFRHLLRLAETTPAFVVTTNVDGQFQKAGWPEVAITEWHGSIHWWQCCTPCCDDIWPAEGNIENIDTETLIWHSDLPRCPHCQALARPNILMFDDAHWLAQRTEDQKNRWQAWLNKFSTGRRVVLEIGAGTAIPTLRWLSRSLVETGALLIRINPVDYTVPNGHIGLPMRAAHALSQLLP